MPSIPSPTLRSAAPLLLAPLALVARADGQSVIPVVLSGDPVANASGVILDIQDMSVNDNGDWIARVRTTVGSSTVDVALIDGGAVLVQGDPLPFPSGSTLDLVDEVDLDSAGNTIWTLDTSAPVSTDNVLYWNLSPLAQEGTLTVGSGFPSGTIWKTFTGFQVSTDENVLISGRVDAPSISGPNEDALVRITYDDAGAVVDETPLLLEGTNLAGTFEQIKQVGGNSGAHDVAIGAGGHWISYARLNSSSSTDEIVVVDGAIVARENNPGPVPGSFWDSLNNNAVGMNDAGDYVHRGTYFVGTSDPLKVIVKNGVPFLTEGDTSPSIAPFGFSDFGIITPLLLGNNGSVVFYGQTDNTDASQSRGFFVNDRFIAQEGVTMAGANLLDTLVFGPNALAMSPSGRYVVFEAFLSDGRDGMFFVDLGLISQMESCSTAAATLSHVDGLPLLGETLGFEMDGGQDIGVTPILLVSTQAAAGWPPCGLMAPFGELLVDVDPTNGNPTLFLTGIPYDGNPSEFSVAVPNDPTLLGQDFFTQGLFFDFGDQSPAENVRLTNGLQIQLATP